MLKKAWFNCAWQFGAFVVCLFVSGGLSFLTTLFLSGFIVACYFLGEEIRSRKCFPLSS